jgi:hypothetical protein
MLITTAVIILVLVNALTQFAYYDLCFLQDVADVSLIGRYNYNFCFHSSL